MENLFLIASTISLYRQQKCLEEEAELIELSSTPPLANDNKLAHEVTSYVKDLVGEQAVILFEQGGMGSEDFASYSYEVPSVYLMLGAGTKNENPYLVNQCTMKRYNLMKIFL